MPGVLELLKYICWWVGKEVRSKAGKCRDDSSWFERSWRFLVEPYMEKWKREGQGGNSWLTTPRDSSKAYLDSPYLSKLSLKGKKQRSVTERFNGITVQSTAVAKKNTSEAVEKNPTGMEHDIENIKILYQCPMALVTPTQVGYRINRNSWETDNRNN